MVVVSADERLSIRGDASNARRVSFLHLDPAHHHPASPIQHGFHRTRLALQTACTGIYDATIGSSEMRTVIGKAEGDIERIACMVLCTHARLLM